MVDSVVYEISKEEIPVSEVPGLDNHVDSGSETPSPGLVDHSLNTPGVGNFAGVGPVEPSPAPVRLVCLFPGQARPSRSSGCC